MNKRVLRIIHKKWLIIAVFTAILFDALIPKTAQAVDVSFVKTIFSPVTVLEQMGNTVFAAPAILDEEVVVQNFPVSDDRTPRKIVWVVATAYSSTPDQTDASPFITANGKQVREGIIAANFLRFGTKVRLPSVFGDISFSVEDRMNARYGYGRIDMWMPTREEAKQFGVQYIQMEIY